MQVLSCDHMDQRFTALVTFDAESGEYTGKVVELPGALTCASSLEELTINLREVIQLMLEDIEANG